MSHVLEQYIQCILASLFALLRDYLSLSYHHGHPLHDRDQKFLWEESEIYPDGIQGAFADREEAVYLYQFDDHLYFMQCSIPPM